MKVVTINGNREGSEKSIAVLGPCGTFSQQAARVYDDKLEPIFFDSISEVIGAVADGVTNVGIVPIENSVHGTVVETIDETYGRRLKIVEEIVIPIRHVVAGVKGVLPDGDIAMVYSHPQGLNQCKKYLEENFFSAKRIKTLSTASAFEKIKEGELVDSIAIGPKIAAEIYGLKIIEEDVQDRENNETSFVVIKRESSENLSANKTTIVVSPKIDRPGLLYDILEVFKKKGINLSKIESRPSMEKLGSYIFYLTLDIGDNSLLEEIINDLEVMKIGVYSLGSYNKICV